jgi:peptidoglycan/LPS O-acetylase OafA/YrhL
VADNCNAAMRDHMPQLDGLRTLAVAAVVLSHWKPETSKTFPWGHLGVQTFFVLSGLLITGILLRCRDTDLRLTLRSFYARRFLRIFPLYYVVVIGAAILEVPHAREMLPYHLTYTSNFAAFWREEWFGHTSHFWTLAVEEQFYIVWPWVVLLAPQRALVPLFVSIIAASTVSREILMASNAFGGVLTTSNMDALVIGALLAILPESRARLVGRIGFAAGVTLLAGGLWFGFFPAVRNGCIAIAVWLVQSAAIGFRGPLGRMLELPPMLWLGKMAYGLYVFHPFAPLIVEWIVQVGFPIHWRLRFQANTIATVTIAAASWYGFEKPINDLKRFFPYVKR